MIFSGGPLNGATRIDANILSFEKKQVQLDINSQKTFSEKNNYANKICQGDPECQDKNL